jgi:hypothetical protein
MLPQEERVSLLLDDLREELLDRLDGLQLRLQVSQEGTLPSCADHVAAVSHISRRSST